MATEISVKGLSDLNAFLQQLPAKAQRNLMRGAMRAGAKVILDEAKALVSVDTGFLKKTLRISGRIRGGVVAASVKTDVFYAPFVEFGTAAHTIVAAPNGVLRFGDVTVKVAEHKGSKPKPFMRPALDNKASEAVVAAGEYMKKRLAKKHGLDTADVQIEADE